MRTLRLSLVGTVILSLVGGLNGLALAQGGDDTDNALITPVRGTLTTSQFDDSDEEYRVDADGARHARGARLEEVYEYDDDRLPPLKRMVLNFDMYPNAGSGDVWILTSTARMDGPDGYWEGTGHWFGPVDGSGTAADIYVGSQDILVGHGAYEGLLAVMGCGGATGCSGYIVEGELPPLPDAVTPPAE